MLKQGTGLLVDQGLRAISVALCVLSIYSETQGSHYSVLSKKVQLQSKSKLGFFEGNSGPQDSSPVHWEARSCFRILPFWECFFNSPWFQCSLALFKQASGFLHTCRLISFYDEPPDPSPHLPTVSCTGHYLGLTETEVSPFGTGCVLIECARQEAHRGCMNDQRLEESPASDSC